MRNRIILVGVGIIGLLVIAWNMGLLPGGFVYKQITNPALNLPTSYTEYVILDVFSNIFGALFVGLLVFAILPIKDLRVVVGIGAIYGIAFSTIIFNPIPPITGITFVSIISMMITFSIGGFIATRFG